MTDYENIKNYYETNHGYVAFLKDSDDKKALSFIYSFSEGHTCWKLCTTEKINNITIFTNRKSAEKRIREYNSCHKNNVEFEIKSVVYSKMTSMKILDKSPFDDEDNVYS